MPVCFLLQLMSRAQKRSLIHKFADQLQAHRQPGCIKAARNRQPRQPRQIDGIGKDVVEVHRNRILGFCAERERGGRAGRTNNYVALLKSGFEILGDNAPDFLRFEVVRVVIASRECVGTNQYSTFDLLAEPFGTGVLIKVDEFLCVFRAMTKPYACLLYTSPSPRD